MQCVDCSNDSLTHTDTHTSGLHTSLTPRVFWTLYYSISVVTLLTYMMKTFYKERGEGAYTWETIAVCVCNSPPLTRPCWSSLRDCFSLFLVVLFLLSITLSPLPPCYLQVVVFWVCSVGLMKGVSLGWQPANHRERAGPPGARVSSVMWELWGREGGRKRGCDRGWSKQIDWKKIWNEMYQQKKICLYFSPFSY